MPCEVCAEQKADEDRDCEQCDVNGLDPENETAWELFGMIPDPATATISDIETLLDYFYVRHPAERLTIHRKIMTIRETIREHGQH